MLRCSSSPVLLASGNSMTFRQSDKLIAVAEQKRIGVDKNCSRPLLLQAAKAASMSPSVSAVATRIGCPTVRAAACRSLN
jgi:hypothetical protein